VLPLFQLVHAFKNHLSNFTFRSTIRFQRCLFNIRPLRSGCRTNKKNTLQPNSVFTFGLQNMSPEYLKKQFGGRLAFHGCISTAGPVATGTVEATIACCRHTLDIMMPGGGYCFSPTHALQDNSLLENVLAMDDTAKK
jgi:hypothetical protein